MARYLQEVNTGMIWCFNIGEVLKAERKPDMSFESSHDLQQIGSKPCVTGYKSYLSAVEVLIYQTSASLL